jgi:hypothetical protein
MGQEIKERRISELLTVSAGTVAHHHFFAMMQLAPFGGHFCFGPLPKLLSQRPNTERLPVR